MNAVIVPTYVSDAINRALDKAIIECQDAAKDREHLFACLLKFFDDNGAIPEFSIEKTDPGANTMNATTDFEVHPVGTQDELQRLRKSNAELLDALRRIATPQSQPSSTRFTVDVENNPRMRFDSADDAVKHAASKVYAGPDTINNALAALRGGQIAEWTYGFGGVTVYPPENISAIDIASAAIANATKE